MLTISFIRVFCSMESHLFEVEIHLFLIVFILAFHFWFKLQIFSTNTLVSKWI